MASSDSEKLLKFPSLFPIKVVGVAREGFTSEIHACVLDLVPDFDPESLENRLSPKATISPSRSGSLRSPRSISIRFTSR